MSDLLHISPFAHVVDFPKLTQVHKVLHSAWYDIDTIYALRYCAILCHIMLYKICRHVQSCHPVHLHTTPQQEKKWPSDLSLCTTVEFSYTMSFYAQRNHLCTAAINQFRAASILVLGHCHVVAMSVGFRPSVCQLAARESHAPFLPSAPLLHEARWSRQGANKTFTQMNERIAKHRSENYDWRWGI